MTVPLVVLAFGSLTVGAYFEWTHGFRPVSGRHAVAGISGHAAARGARRPSRARIGVMSTGITLVGIRVDRDPVSGQPREGGPRWPG